MATTVDLSLGMNLTVGSVPVALEADLHDSPDGKVYTFNGCVQNAEIPLGDFIPYIGSQFGVEVELPPELNLSAQIDYIAGQVIYTKPASGDPTTELAAAAKFELTVGSHSYTFRFFADVIKTSATDKTNTYVVGAALATELDFADLPLVGKIPDFAELTLTDVGFSYTNATPSADKPVEFNLPQVAKSDNPLYTRTDKNAKDASDYTITKDGPQRKFAMSNGGFSLTAGLINRSTGDSSNSLALPLSLPATTPPPYPAPSNFAPGKTSPAKSPVHWIDINKQLGPVDLKQIGLNYAGGEATFGLSAGFALGGFGLDLEGLTITFPLPLPGSPAGKTVSFGLDGLGMSIQRGGFSFSGAFLRVVEADVTSYYGEIAVKVGNFGLKALGGYTPAHDGKPASFFLYAVVQAPLGGPPFLFITGFVGGFGINRTLILPTIDDLPGYILLPSNAPPPAGSPSQTIANILPQFGKYLLDQPGQYWVAAGISFTSFEMINAFALVTVAFGVDFQVALFGQCSMSFPTSAAGTALAYIEIDILASFTPASGLLAVDGRLAPASYIYGGFVQLSGGFAFYIWFGSTQGGDDHKGQFVVSIGGYHPAFNPPDYYPKVPRLTMSAGLGPFQIKGQAYLALTPAMIMAGISMTATWSSGGIKAWFAAGVDFLIAWAPFHYEASAYITVGCSVDLGLFTLSAQVGAALQVWGPEFGGTATVDLDVVSFTIAFGATNSAPKPIDWSTFRASFLPPDTKPKSKPRLRSALVAADPPPVVNILKATVAAGLLGTYDDDNWLVDPNNFRIETNSTIPANQAVWTIEDGEDTLDNAVASWGEVDAAGLYRNLPAKTFSDAYVWNPTVDIKPMKQNGVQSLQSITLTYLKTGKHVTNLSITPILANSASALWVNDGKAQDANAEPFSLDSLTGFAITPIPQSPGTVSNVPLMSLLFSQGSSTGFRYQRALPNPAYQASGTIEANKDLKITISGGHEQIIVNTGLALKALVDPWVSSQRSGLLTDLAAAFATYTPDEVKLTDMAQKALMNWPAVQLLGANQ